MSDHPPFNDPPPPRLDVQKRVNDVCGRFEEGWQRYFQEGASRPQSVKAPCIQAFVPPDWPLDERRALLIELLRLEQHYRLACGEAICAEHYLELFPDLAKDVRAFFAPEPTGPYEPPVAQPPPSIPGFRIDEELGAGAFGVV